MKPNTALWDIKHRLSCNLANGINVILLEVRDDGVKSSCCRCVSVEELSSRGVLWGVFVVRCVCCDVSSATLIRGPAACWVIYMPLILISESLTRIRFIEDIWLLLTFVLEFFDLCCGNMPVIIEAWGHINLLNFNSQHWINWVNTAGLLSDLLQYFLIYLGHQNSDTLSWRWYAAATGGSRTHDLAIAKSSTVPLGHCVPPGVG